MDFIFNKRNYIGISFIPLKHSMTKLKLPPCGDGYGGDSHIRLSNVFINNHILR
jgi:hypothetical protein